MRLPVVCLLVFLYSVTGMVPVFSQDSTLTDLGHVVPADFHPSSPVIDTSADVVVLEDLGNTDLQGNGGGWRVKYTRYCRLLIRSKRGFDATVIHLSYDPEENGTFGPGRLSSLRANTYNLEGGQVIQTVMDTSAMYIEKGDDGHLREKFSFTDVSEGSIVEYAYTIYSG